MSLEILSLPNGQYLEILQIQKPFSNYIVLETAFNEDANEPKSKFILVKI